jgi:hypothetical protein
MGTESVPQDARRIENAETPRENAAGTVLGESGRRVLEKARVDERRGDPDRVQRRDKTELQDRNRSSDQRRGLVIIAGTGQGDGAFMAGRLGIAVNQLVPPRHGAEGEDGEEPGADRTRDDRAKDRKRRP